MARVLFFDIETAPSIIARYDLWSQGQPHHILKEGAITTIGYKFADEEEVHVLSIEDFTTELSFTQGQPLLLAAWAQVLAKADMVIAHYGDKFDWPMLQAAMARFNLPPMPPVLSYDTCKVAKRIFKLKSNSLDYIGQFFGLGSKLSLPKDLPLRLLNKDREAYKLMSEYNKQDVVLLEQVYNKIKVYDAQHPNLLDKNPKSTQCPTCGSLNTKGNGVRHTRAGVYQRHRCHDCKHCFQDRSMVKFRTVKSAPGVGKIPLEAIEAAVKEVLK